MPIFVQHDEQGNITATVRGDRPPPHPRQVAYKDAPNPPPVKDTTTYLDTVAPDNLMDCRLENGAHAPCPEIKKRRENGAVMRAIAEAETRQLRATREYILTGDISALQKIEDEISEHRKNLQV